MPRDPSQWDTSAGASKLNEHADDVVERFRRGETLVEIAGRYGMAASGVQKWLVGQGEYRRKVACTLPECEKTFPFRPRKLYCTNLHARRANARARNATADERKKNSARNKFKKALASGVSIRPDGCERCGVNPGVAKDGRSLLQADHHYGYDAPHVLDVWWLCKSCDHTVSGLRRKGEIVNRDSPANEHIDKPLTSAVLTIDGKTCSLVQWAESNGVTRDALLKRLQRGWKPEDAILKKRRRDIH